MSPSAQAELGRDAFLYFKRLGGYKLDSQVTIVLAALDWCAVQVGKDSWASGSQGAPATTHLAEAGEDRTVLALSLYATIPPGSRETASTNQSVRQDARKKKMDKQQAITSPSLFLCAQVPCPRGIT